MGIKLVELAKHFLDLGKILGPVDHELELIIMGIHKGPNDLWPPPRIFMHQGKFPRDHEGWTSQVWG